MEMAVSMAIVVNFLMFMGVRHSVQLVVLLAAADHLDHQLVGQAGDGVVGLVRRALAHADLVGTAGLADPNRPAGDDDDVIAPVVAVEAEGLVLVQGVQAHGLAVLRHLHGPAGVAVPAHEDHADEGDGGKDGDEDHPKAQGLGLVLFHSDFLPVVLLWGIKIKDRGILLHFRENSKRWAGLFPFPLRRDCR